MVNGMDCGTEPVNPAHPLKSLTSQGKQSRQHRRQAHLSHDPRQKSTRMVSASQRRDRGQRRRERWDRRRECLRRLARRGLPLRRAALPSILGRISFTSLLRLGQRCLSLFSMTRTARSASPSLNLTQKGFSMRPSARSAARSSFRAGSSFILRSRSNRSRR